MREKKGFLSSLLSSLTTRPLPLLLLLPSHLHPSFLRESAFRISLLNPKPILRGVVSHSYAALREISKWLTRDIHKLNFLRGNWRTLKQTLAQDYEVLVFSPQEQGPNGYSNERFFKYGMFHPETCWYFEREFFVSFISFFDSILLRIVKLELLQTPSQILFNHRFFHNCSVCMNK